MQTHTAKFCPYCGAKIDTSPEHAGHFSQCPECDRVFEVHRISQETIILPRFKFPKKRQRDPLCFLLGFFFNVLGILIAAIIIKNDGVVDAVNGLFAFVFVMLIGIVLFLIGIKF